MGEVAVSKSGPRAKASRRTAIAAVAIALGLAGRLLWLPLHGTHDMDVFAGWGDQTMRFGLAHAYYGIYYPLQYQLFAVSSWLASSTGLGTIAAYKLVTLCFEAGAVVLLALLLRRLGADPFYALVLWLQPYFLAISWLGYTDAQFAFFVLLGLTVAAYLPSPVGYLAGGFGLGAAFLMKPQATLLVGVAGALLAATLVKERHRLLHPLARRPFCLALLIVGPTVIFAAYTLYFDAKGGGLTYLARSYQRVLAHPSSALTENMPNVWYPVANLVRSPSEPIYAVTGRPLYHDV